MDSLESGSMIMWDNIVKIILYKFAKYLKEIMSTHKKLKRVRKLT